MKARPFFLGIKNCAHSRGLVLIFFLFFYCDYEPCVYILQIEWNAPSYYKKESYMKIVWMAFDLSCAPLLITSFRDPCLKLKFHIPFKTFHNFFPLKQDRLLIICNLSITLPVVFLKKMQSFALRINKKMAPIRAFYYLIPCLKNKS